MRNLSLIAFIFTSFVCRMCCVALKFCVTLDIYDDNKALQDSCGEINKLSNGTIECVIANDRLRCLENLRSDAADFGVFKAEDIYLAPLLNSTNAVDLVITNEFRQSPNQNYEFDMVVLVSNEVEINSLNDLRGKRLCHPGSDDVGWLYDWSEIFSQYFEEKVVKEECDPRLNVFENKIKSLSSFFGSSCRAGAWSPDDALDEKLKARYNELCAICQSPASCSKNDLYWGRQGPLTCLIDCNGDVAWVRLQDIGNQFQPNPDDNTIRCKNVSLLCPDGTKMPLDSTNPCVWLSRPWSVIMARRTVADAVSSLIDHLNSRQYTSHDNSWQYALRVLLSRSLQPIHPVKPKPLTPDKYLNKIPGFVEANKIQTCKESGADKTIVVCTNNEAARTKCAYMALVARGYSIDPQFRCVLDDNCLGKVAAGEYDVVVVGTDDLMDVYHRNENLTPILYEVGGHGLMGMRFSSATVLMGSKIKRIKDLRGKKACFTKMRGLAWNSLLMVLKENALIDDYCDDVSQMLKFFSDVCVVDNDSADSRIRPCFEDIGIIVEETGSYGLDEAYSLQCITDGGGDVVFLDYNSVSKYLHEHQHAEWTSSLQNNEFRSICPYKNTTSMHECCLSKASYGQVLTGNNLSADRREEIVSAFLLLSSLLGRRDERMKRDPPVFQLFTHDENERNALFESFADRLESADKYSYRINSVNNVYELKLQEMVTHCRRQNEDERVKNYAVSMRSLSPLISIPVIIYSSFLILPIPF